MKKIILLFCAMAVMAGTSAQTENKNKGIKGLWGSLKDAAGQLSSKKKKKIKEVAEKKDINYWEALKSLAEQLPTIKTDQPINSENGFNLIKTNTIGGLKCEHYEKLGKQVRVFYKTNGDYFISNADPDGMNREPDANAKSISMWRITQDGEVFYGGFKYALLEQNSTFDSRNNKIREWKVITDDCIIKQYSNGNQSYYIPFHYEYGKIGCSLYPTYTDFKNGDAKRFYEKEDGGCYHMGVRLAKDSLKIYYPDITTVSLLNRSINNPIIVGFKGQRVPIPNVMIGESFYEWDNVKGEVGEVIAQIYGDKVSYVSNNNKVVSINEANGYIKVTYENGDYFIEPVDNDNSIVEAKFHIGENVFVLKKDDYHNARIEYADGRIFSGQVRASWRGLQLTYLHELTTLLADKVVPLTGTMQDAQGTLWEYSNGKKIQK